MLFNKIYCKAFALATFLSFCTHQAYSQVSNFGYSLKPIKMSFLGTGIVPIKDDNNTKFYDAPHWTENQAAPFIPVCYVSGSTPKVNCLFQITGTCTNAIYVKGQASNGMLFPQQQLTINTAGALYPVIDASAAFAFGQADIFENFTVDWYMTNNPSGGSWVNVGTSTNVMYVTKATPLSILSTREDINQLGGTRLGDTNCPTFHTTLHIGCQYGKGLTTDLSLIDGVYDYFKGKNVQSIEKGFCMQYWGNTYGNPQDAAPLSYYSLGLIKVGDGRCTAWSQFFVEIMRTQGIGGLKGIVIRWKVNETLDASSVSQLEDDLIANNLVVSQGTTLSNLSAKFYVKNWANNLDHSFLELPNSYTAGNTMAQGDEDGLKGQCMNNPWSTFPNHVIVKYGNTYYDPSYGSPTVQNKVDWQNNSISYYGTVIRVRERDMPSGPFRRHYWITAITQNIVEEEINYPF